jgi:SAM-dependent methyltransferase
VGKKVIHEEKNLDLMAETDRYHEWIFNNIRSGIGKRVLEVGGGVGTITEFLLPNRFVVSTEISKRNLSLLKKKFKKNKNFEGIYLDLAATTGDLKKYKFDTVLIVNVLEHIPDDIKCLKNAYKLLPKGGKLILVLPAFNFAFGTIDVADNHFRRYNKKIIPALEKIGFRVKKAKYMNTVGLLGWLWHGRVLRLKEHIEGDIKRFNALVPTLERMERIIPFMPGLSLVVIAEKNKR